MAKVITVSDFNFTIEGDNELDLPQEEPDPSDYVRYTAWHIDRAMTCHNNGPPGQIVPPILAKFPDLKVVRAFQPYQRLKYGKLEFVKIRKPEKSREQGAILLYALLPGEEKRRCSCCNAVDGSGPFSLCIPRREFSNFACLNCWFTGTPQSCDLRHEHERKVQEALVKQKNIPVHFPEGAEKTATSAELTQWCAQIDREIQRRAREAGNMQY